MKIKKNKLEEIIYGKTPVNNLIFNTILDGKNNISNTLENIGKIKFGKICELLINISSKVSNKEIHEDLLSLIDKQNKNIIINNLFDFSKMFSTMISYKLNPKLKYGLKSFLKKYRFDIIDYIIKVNNLKFIGLEKEYEIIAGYFYSLHLEGYEIFGKKDIMNFDETIYFRLNGIKDENGNTYRENHIKGILQIFSKKLNKDDYKLIEKKVKGLFLIPQKIKYSPNIIYQNIIEYILENNINIFSKSKFRERKTYNDLIIGKDKKDWGEIYKELKIYVEKDTNINEDDRNKVLSSIKYLLIDGKILTLINNKQITCDIDQVIDYYFRGKKFPLELCKISK